MTRKTMPLAAALLSAALTLPAQETSGLEAEAKRAFDSGLFAEAGDKYSKAARTAGLSRRPPGGAVSAGRVVLLHRRQREERPRVAQGRVHREAVPDRRRRPLQPRFRAALPGRAHRGHGRGRRRGRRDGDQADGREKLQQGNAEDAVASLKRGAASNDPELHRLLGEAYDRLGRASEADQERRRATELERGSVTTAPIGGPARGGARCRHGSRGRRRLAPIGGESPQGRRRAGRGGGGAARRRGGLPQRRRARACSATCSSREARRPTPSASSPRPSASTRPTPGRNTASRSLAERQGKWNTAGSLYRRTLDLAPNNVAAALGLGRSMEELKDLTAARLAYGRAIEIDPSSAEAHNDFGVFLCRSGELDRAIEEMVQAVKLAPQRSVVPREPRPRFPQEGPAARGGARARRRRRGSRRTKSRSGRRSETFAASSRSPTTRPRPTRRPSTSTRRAKSPRPASRLRSPTPASFPRPRRRCRRGSRPGPTPRRSGTTSA